MVKRQSSGKPSQKGTANVSLGLREVLDGAPDAIFCCDDQGRFQWVSAAAEAIAGVRASDLLGTSFTKLVPLPYRNHVAHHFLRRARHLQPDARTDAIRISGASGQEVWLSVRSKLAQGPDGEVVFIGVARPMSEAEIGLASGESPARIVAPARPMGAPFEPQTRFAEELPRLQTADVTPTESVVMPAAESNAQVLAAIQVAKEARAEAEKRLEQLRLEHDAALQRVSSLSAERDGAQRERDEMRGRMDEEKRRRDEIDRALADANARRETAEREVADANARRESAEREVADAERRYKDLEQSATAGADARTQSALQQLEAMRAEHRRLQDAARAETAQAVERARLDGLRALEAARLEGAKAIDEARFEANRSAEAVRAEHARAIEAARAEQLRAGAGSSRDLEAVRAESQQLQARLAEAERRCAEMQAQFSTVERRARDAQSALSEAQAQAQLKGDFLATISQEIRNPMNGVMGMTHLLLETDLDNDQRNLVEVIRNSSQALLHLINDTLDFSKLEAGRLEIETLDFDLRVTVDEVSALLAPMANAKTLDFVSQVSHEVPSRLKGDPARIRQVLFNLGGNAIKFTEKGRVSVRVDRLAEDDARVTLKFSVTDTGQGAARDDLARVFQSSAPPDASITRQYGGTGLGLAISRSLVTLMGGEVGVETSDGTFWFCLSLDKQAAPAEAATPQDVQLRGMRVMVVDPSKNIRQSLGEMLKAWGCEADEAETADQALSKMRAAAAKGKAHQVAIIEMQLPGMDGEQLGWVIRSDAALERTLTMMMTSVGRKGDAQRAQTKGFSAYLLKPIEWSELYDGLVEVVRSGQRASSGSPQSLVTRHSLAEARRGRMRILVVEDNVVNQLVANWALQRHGYTIDGAINAAEALSKSEAQHYDLILMDVQMPDMDGFKATTAIRARERGGQRTPIVAMTGNTQQSELERCRAAGMDDWLPKPIDIGELCSVVEHWTRANAKGAGGDDRSASRPSPITFKAPDLEKKLERMARGDGTADGPRSVGTAPQAPGSSAGSGASSTPAPPSPGDGPEVPIDSARLQGSSMGIAALRDTLLNTFLADVPPRLERLAAAMIEHEAQRIEYEAHGLMGMCATVGAVSCERVFAQIQRLAAEDRVSECTRLLDTAKAEVERTEAYISRLEQILSRAA